MWHANEVEKRKKALYVVFSAVLIDLLIINFMFSGLH